MKRIKLADDIIIFFESYTNSIILSDNETANIEFYLRSKGIMDMARFYYKKGTIKECSFIQIEKKFKEIENLTILRIGNTMSN